MQSFLTKFCGTSFDDMDVFEKKIRKLDFKYFVIGDEICPTTKRPHRQYFVILNKKKRFSSLQKQLKCHIEPTRGTDKQAADYCKKDGVFIQSGEEPVDSSPKVSGPQQWQALLDLAVDHRFEEIRHLDPRMFVTHFHRWKAIQDHFPRQFPRVESRTSIWIWCSKSGVGKSRWCDSRFPEAYRKSLTSKFFQGYLNQDTILIEDIDTSCASFGHDLKLWADIYPLLVEVKGSHVYLQHRRLIVTSNYRIGEIFSDTKLIQALYRRFHVVHAEGWEDNDLVVSTDDYRGLLNNYLYNIDFF